MEPCRRIIGASRGLTLIELIVVIAIIGILASAAMPLSRMTLKRVREMELRSDLRTIRSAIDQFRKDCLPNSQTKLSSDYCKSDQDYYPESLDLLIKPLKLSGTGDKTKKYLRRIPSDPMMPVNQPDDTNNWGMRSYKDDPDSKEWGGGNVFDVYSRSEAVSLDGTKYNTW